MYEQICRSISWGILVSSAAVRGYDDVDMASRHLCEGQGLTLYISSSSPRRAVAAGNRQVSVTGGVTTKGGVQCGSGTVQDGESSLGSHGISTSNQDEKVSTNVPKWTSSFLRWISLQNAFHTNMHTARSLCGIRGLFSSITLPLRLLGRMTDNLQTAQHFIFVCVTRRPSPKS